MSRPEMVIFDCDGVLVDSERLIQEVDLELIGGLGWPITREEIFAEHLGRSEDAVVANIERRLGRAVPASFRQQKARRTRRCCVSDWWPCPAWPRRSLCCGRTGYECVWRRRPGMSGSG